MFVVNHSHIVGGIYSFMKLHSLVHDEVSRLDIINTPEMFVLSYNWSQLSFKTPWPGNMKSPISQTPQYIRKYPTMHHFVRELCTRVHISVTKWCIVGYRTGALWNLCKRSHSTSYEDQWRIDVSQGYFGYIPVLFHPPEIHSWWRHQMETFSALLAICEGNSPVPGEFPTQRPVTRSFDVFFDLRLHKRLCKQWWCWWFETLSRPLWRLRNEIALKQASVICYKIPHCWSSYDARFKFQMNIISYMKVSDIRLFSYAEVNNGTA